METAISLEPTDGPLTVEELQLATRNRGMPLEAMAYDLTPTGLHYLLIHFDIPVVDAASWRLSVSNWRTTADDVERTVAAFAAARVAA